MILTYVAPFCALIGLLVYALSSNPKASELGRLLFLAGTIATLFLLNGAHPLRL